MKDLSLYFHIPFCKEKCDYCDFFSITDFSLIHTTLEFTLLEFEILYRSLGMPGIDTIFIGGGTPNSLPPGELQSFIRGIASIIQTSDETHQLREWSIESNPEFITSDFLAVLNDSPITRLSIGVQSFRDETLKTLGRNTDAARTKAALELASRRFKGDLSIDLICEVPGQSSAQSLEDLRFAMDFGLSHISRYSLIIEAGTPFAERYTPRDSSIDEDCYFQGIGYLADHGFRRYEVSNFALPGKECLHNLRYWRMDPYLGCGPAAVSTLPPLPEGPDGWFRRTNPSSIFEYRRMSADLRRLQTRGESPFPQAGAGLESLDWRELFFEHCIMGFRTKKGIDIATLSLRCGPAAMDLIHRLVQSDPQRFFLENRRFYLNAAYFDRQNTVLGELWDILQDFGSDDRGLI